MRPICAALLLLAAACASPAGTIWVDVNNTSGVEDGSAAHPFNTVQEGIDAAVNGDEVVVLPGEYVETVTLEGSGITSNFTLRSTDPLDPDVVAATVINGNLDGDPQTPEESVVTFSGWEDATCELAGVTITGGKGRGIHGGRYYVGWDLGGALIHNCVVTGNAGGGISACAGPVVGCTIRGNTAYVGAGLCLCQGGVKDCAIVGNTAQRDGGGLSQCGEVVGCLIAGNVAGSSGGGLETCWEIRDCVIAGNSAGVFGGGAYGCGSCHDVDMANCTVVGNVALSGSGLSHAGPLASCIIWGNSPQAHPQVDICSDCVTYSCIQNWTRGGEGNISADPMFVDYNGGDYRLLPASPCIDSANGYSAPEFDITGRARCDHPEVPNTGVGDPPYADMGAYESYLQTFTSPPGLLRRGWNLVSLPIDPAPHHPESVWGNQLAAGNILTGNLYGYINPTGYTEYTRTLTAMEHARGYWLRLRYPTAEDVVGEATGGPVSISLELGWNLIGHPLPDDVLWHACLIRHGEQELHIPQAAFAGWIQEAAFGFSPGSGQYFRVPEYDPFLRPWQGYWVLAYRAGLELVVP